MSHCDRMPDQFALFINKREFFLQDGAPFYFAKFPFFFFNNEDTLMVVFYYQKIS